MKIKLLLVFSFFVIMLTGCAGIKNIQDLTYIVGIGMDYDSQTKEYIVYLQGLNFANVAKQEGGKPADPVPIFVATARGESLNIAVGKLYKKSEPPLYFGHIKTLILSQRLIDEKSEEVLSEVARNRSIRHRLRIVTTEEKIEDILNVRALYDYPAVYTVLFKEKAPGLAQNELTPTSMLYFLRDYYEPMGVAKIPIVKIDKSAWKADEEYPILFFDGYSVFQNKKFVRNIGFEEALYMEWLLNGEVTLFEKVMEEDKIVAAISLERPRLKVKYDKQAKVPQASIEIKPNVDIVGKITEIEFHKFKKLVEEDVKKKVEHVFNKGIENNLDLLDLGDKWFRLHPKEYKELKESGEFYLTTESLQEIKVNAQILNFNAYEYEKKG